MADRTPVAAPAASAARVRAAALPLTGGPGDYDPLLERVADARFVLLGEASHGTHEFYRERAEITKRLIEDLDFTAVAVEADWPDARRVHEFVTGESDVDAREALGGFDRFPTWMWRNHDVLDFIRWLREHNAARPEGRPPVGFHGLDLYNLFASIEAVLEYLDRVDPDAARRARHRYACFAPFAGNPQAYGQAVSVGVTPSCRDHVAAQLVELRRLAAEYLRRDGREAAEAYFTAEQNARLARGAEAYYRTLFEGGASSWNLRDRHMAETLAALVDHETRLGRTAKVAVWAHNSHLGDARATEMGWRGELNLGQLVRERWGRQAVAVGFSTFTGTVTAAPEWGAPALRMRVRPALPGSYEALFREAGPPRFLLPFRGRDDDMVAALRGPRLERAIGVIYRPDTERISHYFEARLPDQFDAVLHFDETTAVEPLEPAEQWNRAAPPETFPFGV